MHLQLQWFLIRALVNGSPSCFEIACLECYIHALLKPVMVAYFDREKKERKFNAQKLFILYNCEGRTSTG